MNLIRASSWLHHTGMDKFGNRDGRTRKLLSLVKAVVPMMAQNLVDRVIQCH
eukprot:SAG31_NODE_14751_length_789_cov_1.104348_2_plen_51_part_01